MQNAVAWAAAFDGWRLATGRSGVETPTVTLAICGTSHGALALIERHSAVRGSLGQWIETAPGAGHDICHTPPLFDRVEKPARGRNGGGTGAPGRVGLIGGTPRPGSPARGEHDPPADRDPAQVTQDLRAGRPRPEQTRKNDDDKG